MRFSRVAVVLAFAVVAGGGFATGTAGAARGPAPTVAAAVGGARDGDGRAPKRCRYAVRRIETRLNVRGGPGTRYRIVDKLYPGDYTWGSCRKFGRWRKVRGVDADRLGFSHAYYLRRIDTR
ncbi:hypothetical protein [Nonomuraea ferruginea]|uniref:SH3 domain-containing protein n=1 Tax=Nonomuraea ferruginea TaxID=46174 RepID=A0ABT4SW05_9ACTN|nr:hypothetical protein [Nonomuraea ferruginea]MDA0641447.1 hypothetical protein [Nonomuraea ferruginea]